MAVYTATGSTDVNVTRKTYGWNSVIAYPRMPEVGGTVNSEPFNVPRGADTMVIHFPDLAGAGTVSLQSLNPSIAADGTETWSTIRVIATDAAGAVIVATPAPITALVDNLGAVVFYKSEFGSGVLRLVSTVDQSAAPVNISVVFGF